MPKEISIAGEKFGRWTAVERGENSSHKRNNIRWVCKCECGNVALINKASLMRGDSTSCGCYSSENRLKVNKVHGTRADIPKISITFDQFCQNTYCLMSNFGAAKLPAKKSR